MSQNAVNKAPEAVSLWHVCGTTRLFSNSDGRPSQ